jgi:predicted RNase H-like HicB family nuclease
VEHVEIVAWAEPRSAFGWLSGVAYNRSRELGAVARGSCALGESSLSSWLSRKLLKPLQIGMQDMPERMKLTVVLRREEDGGYSAQCLELPGCVSEGDTWEEALENIKEAILGYLEAFPEEIEKLKEEEKETVEAVV